MINFNFSLDRFLHLVKVRNYLRAQGNPLFKRIEKKLPLQGQEKTPPPSQTKMPLLLAVGAAGILLMLLISRLFNR